MARPKTPFPTASVPLRICGPGMRPISRNCPTPKRCPGPCSMGKSRKPYSTPDRTRCTTSRRKSRNPRHSWKTSARPRPTRRKPRNARSNRPSAPRARAKRVDSQPTKPTAPPRRKRRPAISRLSSSPPGTAGSTKGANPRGDFYGSGSSSAGAPPPGSGVSTGAPQNSHAYPHVCSQFFQAAVRAV